MTGGKTVVFVTGCSQGGIGFSLCEEFASQGCVVYATARRPEALEGLKGDIHRLTLDVTNDENVNEVVHTVVNKEGQIDLLVNNAGFDSTCESSSPLADVAMDEVIRTFNTNVFAAIRTAKAVIPHMAARKRGTIVNVGSIAGLFPLSWGGIYCSSKAALHSITDTLHMECKPLNINVVLIAPGAVQSNVAANQPPTVRPLPGSLYADYADSILKKRGISQTYDPTPRQAFARTVVSAVLRRRPPRYLSIGSKSRLYELLQWFPRGWVLNAFWKIVGEGGGQSPRKGKQKQKGD